jgi:LysR family cys regulon transcriptional activator
VGIVASMAIDPREDADLLSIDATHLFPSHTTWAGYQQGALLRGYMYDFLQLLAPHLTRRLIDRAGNAATQADVEALFADVDLPVFR